MTCREFASFLADYLTGELPEPTVRRFDEHLDVCENCRRYLTSYQETVKLGRRAFEDETAALPADVPEELIQAVLSATRGPSRS